MAVKSETHITTSPSAEAIQTARKLLISSHRGGCVCATCEDEIARAIDDAFRRGQVAEREEAAKLVDVAYESVIFGTEPSRGYDVAIAIKNAIRARTP